MSQKDVDNYNIEPCGCGESEFLQVLPRFNKKQVHCVNCGNQSFAMSTAEKAVEAWNKTNRFEGKTCNDCKLDCKNVVCGAFERKS